MGSAQHGIGVSQLPEDASKLFDTDVQLHDEDKVQSAEDMLGFAKEQEAV